MNEEKDRRITRIVVALNASSDSLAALRAAADLAASLGAELIGLYVEDIDLLHMAELPFTRELRYAAPGPSRLERRDMERSLRAQSERMRRALADSARRARVEWSYRVTRGSITRELLAVASDTDLLIVGKEKRSLEPGRRLGTAARTVISQAQCTVAVITPMVALNHPVLTVYDGSPAGWQALEIAAQLAQADDRQLVVLLRTSVAQPAADLRAQLLGWLERHEIEADFNEISGEPTDALIAAVRREGARALVLNAGAAGLDDEKCQQLVDSVNCPVILVR